MTPLITRNPRGFCRIIGSYKIQHRIDRSANVRHICILLYIKFFHFNLLRRKGIQGALKVVLHFPMYILYTFKDHLSIFIIYHL